MKGYLHKKENGGWTIKWSDLHSFAQGTHWMYTELHPESNSLQLKHDEEVDFEFIADDDDPFNPHKYVKIIKPKKEKSATNPKNRK